MMTTTDTQDYNFNGKVERTPPIDIDSERMCLGLMMVDPKLVYFIRQHVGVEDFYRIQHQYTAKIIYALADKGIAPDPVAVITLWNESEKTTIDSDSAFIFELMDSVPVSVDGSYSDNAVWYAKRVKERSERRALIRMISSKYHDLMDPIEELGIEDIIGDMVSNIFQIKQTSEIVNISTELRDIMNLIQSGDVFGISTGFESLDKFSCGYQNGEFYVLGGRPGMGKTALALKLVANLCTTGTKVMIASLEMPIRQLLLRLLSIEARVPYRCFRQKGAIPEASIPSVVVAASKIANWPLFVDDNPGITIEQIISRIEAQVFQQGVEVVFVDHMHLIPTGGYGVNNAEAYSHISLMLKNLARQMNIPVVCLAQLSRNTERRSDPRPKLSDLRESGGIEQNADNVWFLYRESYYEQDKNTYNTVQQTELIIAKNKSLETGTVYLDFKGAFMEFIDSGKNIGNNEIQGSFGYEG